MFADEIAARRLKTLVEHYMRPGKGGTTWFQHQGLKPPYGKSSPIALCPGKPLTT